MQALREKSFGLLFCFLLGLCAYFLGKQFPVVGGPVFGILIGILITVFWKDKGILDKGIGFCSKYILQTAVVLLGFGLNLNVILSTGIQSLPIIVTTISTALLLSWLMSRLLRCSGNTAVLVGVGSSICGGSAIAATAPVLEADENELAQSISVIFFYNVIAAIFFPLLGQMLGMDVRGADAFGIFAGTAINDTSSVTAAASTWDLMHQLGNATLDKAVTVKLTRTLAIIPITLFLALSRARQKRREGGEGENAFRLRKALPLFIVFFVLASLLTTIGQSMGMASTVFAPFKELSKFLIVMAMGAVGLHSDLIKLVKTGGKPLLIGAVCWIGITLVSLLMQRAMGIW